jgi:hypothetical protein
VTSLRTFPSSKGRLLFERLDKSAIEKLFRTEVMVLLLLLTLLLEVLLLLLLLLLRAELLKVKLLRRLLGAVR